MAIQKVDLVSLTDLPARTSQRAPSMLPQPAQDQSPPVQRSQEHHDIEVSPGASLRFRVDPDTGRTVASVVNAVTGEIMRQIPSEEALALAKTLGKLQGLVLDLKV